MGEILWQHISKQVLFCFILLPFVYLPAPKKNKNCDIKQKLYIEIFLLKLLFSLLSIIFKQLLPFAHLPTQKKNETCDIKKKLFI